ncbi:MAG: fibronectin type III domain-containing protein, partial [Candidatus Hinthialibacter sp.]
PGMEWHSDNHTNQLVPFFAKGPGSNVIANANVGVDEKYGAYVDNTVIAQSLRSMWVKHLPPRLQFLVKPYLQKARKDQITVMFETNIPTQAKVKFGEATLHAKQANLSQTAADNALKTLHEITLNNLKTETNYFYQVAATDEKGKTIESDTLSFKTNVKDDSAYSFAVFSDTQTNPSVWGKIAKLAWEERPHFAVHGGDIVGTGQNTSQWIDHFFKPGYVFMRRIPV